MATFTVTTTVNMDSLSGKAGDDTYNVNGGTLTIDRDTRYGNNPSNSHGTISGSATLGGTIKFRSDKIRLIYFTGGSGTVPAHDTTITQGSASGHLIGVHTALNAAPSTPGAAMPASGYIRVTQWNSVAFAAGALTGITATAAADPVFGTYDRAGWLIDVGRDSKNTNVSRLNNPNDDPFKGEWFLMGYTDGNRSTTYQIPSNGDAMYIAGVQVETSPGSGVFEWWPTTSSPMTVANLRTSGPVSKQCHITPAAAQIRFGHDGTNSTGGACPASGCLVRVPNLFLQCATAASPTTNSFSAIASRHYFYANGAGKWNMDKVSSAWRANIVTNAYEINVTDTSICENLLITSNAAPFTISRLCLGMPADAPSASDGFTLSGGSVGGTVEDSVFGLGNLNARNRSAINLSSTGNVTFDRCKTVFTGNPTTNPSAVTSSITDSITFDDCFFTGWHNHSQSTNMSYTNFEAAGTPGAPIDVASNAAWMSLSNKCSGFLVENGDFPETETLGKGNFITVAGSSSDNKFRNLGTAAAPISARSAIQYDLPWTRSGTTVTVTQTGHGYRTNDYLSVVYSSDSNATGSGLKTATVTGANTFTFTGVNAGATSGTVTLFRTFCAVVVSLTSGDNNEFQNIWVDGAYSRPVNAGAGAQGPTFLNVYGGLAAGSSTLAANDMTTRGVSSNGTAPSGTSAQYGHTFLDGSTMQDLSLSPFGTGVSWTRSGNTITVTSPDHGLDVAQRIRVTSPSDPAPMGAATTVKSGTPLTKDTFTFAGAASGATSGTLDWRAATDKITMFMNEQSDSVQRYTIDAGTPAFTGAGTFAATSVGDQITWEMPEFLVNYTGFAQLPMETGLSETVTALGVFHFTYDIAKDGGNWSGTFRNLSRIITTTGGTSGTPTMTFASTTDIAAGDRVWGLNVPTGAYVVSVDSGTQITLSANLLGTASGDYLFNHLPAETFTDTFKLKVRIKTLTANALSNTYVNIPLTSDATSRALVYPIEELYTLTFTNVEPGSDVRVLDSGAVTSRFDAENVGGSSVPFEYAYQPGDVVDIQVLRDGYKPFRFEDFVLGNEDSEFLVQQVVARNEGT